MSKKKKKQTAKQLPECNKPPLFREVWQAHSKTAFQERPPKILCKLLNKYFQSAKTARESRN